MKTKFEMRKLYICYLVVLIMPLSSCYNWLVNDDVHASLYNGIDTIEINTEWIDEGATITYGEACKEMIPSGFVDVSTLGTYEITYTVLHDDENYEIVRIVTVVDETAPVLTLISGEDTIIKGEEWEDEGVAVIDNSLETITYITTGEVDIDKLGVYIITYTAVDSSGNISTIDRVVYVIEENIDE